MKRTAMAFLSLCSLIAFNQALSLGMEVKTIEPKFLLPASISPLEGREAKITPEEYPLSQELRPLLEAENYSGVLNKLKSLPKDSLSAAVLFLYAQVAMQQKSYDLSEEKYKESLKLMPDFVRAHQGLALLYLLTDREAEAHLALTKSVSLGAADAETYGQLGYINLKNHNGWSAINAYQQALMLQPENNQWKKGLIVALTEAHQYASAKSLVEEMLKDDSDNQALWLQRANIAMQEKENNIALASLEAAIRLGNKESTNLLLAAQLHLQNESYDRALTLLSDNLNQAEIDLTVIYQALGWLEQNKKWKHLNRLLAVLGKKITSMSSQEKGHYYLYKGSIAESNKQLKTAETAFNNAIKSDPNNGKALLKMAMLLDGTQKYTRSEIYYNRAITIKAIRQEAMLGKAQLYINQKDYATALSVLKETFKEYPGNSGLQRNIHTLANIVAANQQN